MKVPKRAADRITAGLKKYQAILAEARNRDISESDTVVIIVDMLADLLGYKKYVEVTTEFAIRGTFVDLAVKLDDEVRFLIEAKAIGVGLKDAHVKQAIDYGANQGIDWVILTNGVLWRVYKILFQKPVEKSLVFELNILDASPRDPAVVECLGRLSREGFTKSSMTEFLQQQQATGKFSVAAVLQSDPVVSAARRELRRLYPSVRVDEDVLRSVIQNDVLKREVVDSDEARLAREALRKAEKAAARSKARAGEEEPERASAGISPVIPARREEETAPSSSASSAADD